MASEPHKTVADCLLELLGHTAAETRVTVGDIVNVLEGRTYGALMLFFAFPVLIPNPVPGLTSIFGIPLVLIAGQMLLGISKPRLPAFITKRSIDGDNLRRMIDAAVPWLRRCEKYLRPRLDILTSKAAERLVALACLFMAFVLMLPVPFSNFIPATAICFIALGLFERDGIFIIVGVVGGIAAIALIWKFVFEIVLGVLRIFSS